jgi:hypothetical protein
MVAELAGQLNFCVTKHGVQTDPTELSRRGLYERTGYSKATEAQRYSCGATFAPPKINLL